MRRVSERSLGNAALFYLRRYPATVAQLTRVLRRKAARAGKGQAGLDPADVERWVQAVVARMVRAGYLDDQRFAQARAASLRRAGKSARAVGAALRVKGVSAELTASALAAAEPDAVAVWTYARKRRLGVYRGAARPEGWREKDLARLARAGFAYALARKVVDAERPPALEDAC